MNDIVAQILKNPLVRCMRSGSDPTYQHVFYMPFVDTKSPHWPAEMQQFCDGWEIPRKKPSDIKYIVTTYHSPTQWENDLERQRMVREWYAKVPSMADPVPDPPFEPRGTDILGTLTPEIKLGIRHAIARNASVHGAVIDCFNQSFKQTQEFRWFLDEDCEIVKPLHLVASMRELVRRTINNTVRVVLPYYANWIMFDYSILNDLDEWQAGPMHQGGIMPSLTVALLRWHGWSYAAIRARWPALVEMPLIPVNIDYIGASIVLDPDGIRDALDIEGWTPLMILFAIEQLKLDTSSNRTFFKFLCVRTDLPDSVSDAMLKIR